MEHTKISTDIEQNIKQFQQLFADSADIKMKEMRLGKGKKRRCFLAYIEVGSQQYAAGDNRIGETAGGIIGAAGQRLKSGTQ